MIEIEQNLKIRDAKKKFKQKERLNKKTSIEKNVTLAAQRPRKFTRVQKLIYRKIVMN